MAKIYGTGKYPDMEAGKEFEVTDDMAELLVGKGAATVEKEEKKAVATKEEKHQRKTK